MSQSKQVHRAQVARADEESPAFIETSEYCNKVYPDRKQIFIYDDITPDLALEVAEVASYWKSSTTPIEIKINSKGGDLYGTISIVSELMSIPAKILVDVTGVALSGAAMIALAGDFVRISRFGLMMFHFPNWGVERQSLYSHKTDVKQIELLCDRFFREMLVNSKLSFDDFKKASLKNDFYMTPRQALKYGIVHEIY